MTIVDGYNPSPADLEEAHQYFQSLDKPDRRAADRRKSAEQIAARVTIANLAMFATGMIFALYCLK